MRSGQSFNQFFKKTSLGAIFAVIVLMIATPIFTSPAYAQTTYSPGVKVGDSVTFGKIGAIWRSNSTPPSFIQQINQTRSIQENVTNVSGKIVTATQTFTYKNGTVQTTTGAENVQDGNGTLFLFILAGGLSAGDQLYQTPYPSSVPPIGETVIRLYAGALRSVNTLNATNLIGPQSQIVFDWDAKTGFLLELLETASYPFENFSIYFKVTSTNVWPPSSPPDFGFDAVPQSSQIVYLGEALAFTLILNSTNNFNGIINLRAVLLNSTQPKPSLSLTRSSVSLSSGKSNSSILRFSTNASTPLGLYLFSVNGTSGIHSHTITLAVTVSPPDFDMVANPANLTLGAGTSKTSTITIGSLGSFSGTVSLSTIAYYPLSATVQPTSVTLSATVTSANSTLTVQVPPGTPPNPYTTVYVTGTSGALSHQVYIPVNVTGPDFRIDANPYILSIRAGARAQSTITLGSIMGFAGTISLSPFSSSFSVTASLDKTSVSVNSTTSASATLNVTVAPGTSPGFYSVGATGNSGNLSHSTYVEVNVTAPGFRMTINPSSFTLQEGSSANSTITLTSFLGFHATVTLATYSYYNGPTLSINPSSVALAANATATSTLTVSTTSSNPGFYYFQISAQTINQTQYSYVTVNVIGPDFSMSTFPQYLNVPQGGSAISTVTMDSLDNFNGTIGLSTSVYGPSFSGLNATISPLTVTLSSTVTSATANVTITASKTATPGFYNVYAMGTSGRLSHNAFIGVNVTPAPEFEISTSPASFNSGGQDTSTITITPLNGFTGVVNLTSTVTPSVGLTASCPASLKVMNFSSVQGKCVLTSTTPGVYTLRIRATSGLLTHDALPVVISVGGFQVSVKTPVDFNSGASGEVVIYIAGMNNFNGTITLTGSSPGLAINCPAVAVVLSANSNVSQTCSVSGTVAGTYRVTITATASPGSLSHSAIATVHVGEFTILAGSGSFNVGASGASIRLTLISTFNYAGSVALTGISPGGLTVACPSAAVAITANATVTASCSLSSSTAGIYPVSVGGVGSPGTAVHSAPATVHVGDFAMVLTPVDINSGTASSMTVSLTSINNFAGTISLSGADLNGFTITCPGPASVAANTTIVTYCTLTSTTPGTQSVTITGTGLAGTASHTASALVHVGDFAITVGSSVNFSRGSPNPVIPVNLTSKFNFAGTIVLSPQTSPTTGLTVTCPVATLTANASSTVNCTLNADNTGTFLVTITGASLPGTGSHSSSGVVQVVDFSISAGAIAPSTITIGSTATSSITVTGVNGFTGAVTLAVSPPSGLSCNFDHTTIQSQGTSNLSCTGNTPGDYTVTVTAIGASTFHQTSLTFHVASGSSGASQAPSTMLGLQLPQFYGLIGGIIVAIAVAGVTVAVRRKKPRP